MIPCCLRLLPTMCFPSNMFLHSLYDSHPVIKEVIFVMALPQRQFYASTFCSTRLLVYLFLLIDRSRSPTRNRRFDFFRVVDRAVWICSHPFPSLNPAYIFRCSSSLLPVLALLPPFLHPRHLVLFRAPLVTQWHENFLIPYSCCCILSRLRYPTLF